MKYNFVFLKALCKSTTFPTWLYDVTIRDKKEVLFIWNGFKGLDASESIVANCINLPHDENEMIRKDHDDTYFKYNWSK